MTRLQGASLTGSISADGVLSAHITCEGSLFGTMSKPVGYVDYTGDYEVTPKVSAQTMNTKDKHMTQDVTIKAIPYFDVSNLAGGSTVYIGSEV